MRVGSCAVALAGAADVRTGRVEELSHSRESTRGDRLHVAGRRTAERTQQQRRRARVEILTQLQCDFDFLGEWGRDVLGHDPLGRVRPRQLRDRNAAGGFAWGGHNAALVQRFGKNNFSEARRLRHPVGVHERRRVCRDGAADRHRVRPVPVRHIALNVNRRSAAGPGRRRRVDERGVGSMWGEAERRALAFFRRSEQDVDRVVVDDDRRNDETGAAVTLAFGKEGRIDDHAAAHALDTTR